MASFPKIKLVITRAHIAQARALREISQTQGYISVSWTCPLALAAREAFARPCQACASFIGVFNEGGAQIALFEHFRQDLVAMFDDGSIYRKSCLAPFHATLTRF